MKLDPAAAEFVQRSQTQAQAKAETQATASRETKLRPHETRRKARMMNVTFPSEAWPEALRELAKLRELRPVDLVVWCVSYTIAQVRDGKVTAPSGEGKQQHHKACEWMSLPWDPGKNK